MTVRSFLTAALTLLPPLALPAARAREVTVEDNLHDSGIAVHQYVSDTAYTQFSLFFPGADESLVLELEVYPTEDLETSDVRLNDQKLHLTWDDSVAESSQSLDLYDSSGIAHGCNISWIGIVAPLPPALFTDGENYLSQNIHFQIAPIDESFASSEGFTAVMRPNAPERLVGLIPDSGSSVVRFHEAEYTYVQAYEDSDRSEASSEDGVDLEAEVEELVLLEKQAQALHDQIKAKKQFIKNQLKEEHGKLCIKHLIKECDGVISAAKAIAHRICEKMGIDLGHDSSMYAKIKTQNEMVFTQTSGASAQSVNIPLMLTKGKSAAAYHAVDFVESPNLLLQILGAVATVLGLAALYALIKRKCMSARRRVERAADKEERQNARAYRRAARRALMRKRWDDFRNAINCFRSEKEPRIEDYEEKRALILQDAFLEQDLDSAEKGEVMEAEIRELRYAHQIVSSLVHAEEVRYDFVPPVHDPPPPLVPLPYTPATRSRASTYTLPSYTSESLPDYTSRPADDRSSRSNSLVEFTPPTSNTEGLRSPPPPSEISWRTRFTPTSSVIETSPRPSAETLRTRQSGETAGRY